MKRILIVLCFLFLFIGTGCSLNDNTKEEAVETFFEKYRMQDDTIIAQLKEVIDNEDINEDSKKMYQELMQKQYDQFAYVIKNVDETEDKNHATAEVELTVLNYRSAILEAEEDLKNNPENFNDESGNFSEEKYMDYKVQKMKDVTDTTTHTIELSLTKENGIWKVEQLSNDDISKLHGLY